MPSQRTGGRLQSPTSAKQVIRTSLKRILLNLAVADRLDACLVVSDDSGGGVLHCVLLVPIHSSVEARNCRNLPEILVTMRIKVLKVDTWFSTVSSSPFQPAMARSSPPSVALEQTKFPVWLQEVRNINL